MASFFSLEGKGVTILYMTTVLVKYKYVSL